MAEAFVYEWKNKTNGKKYIGYHQGDENDGYVFSSKDEELLEAIARGQMERTIVANGTTQDMITLERNMLLEADAANNPEYYNKTNGGGKDLKAYIQPNLDILEMKIKTKQYPTQMLQKDIVATFDKFQIRFNEIDPKHVRHLKEVIDDKNGDTTNFDPVDVLEDYYGKGKHLLLNGNQRLTAIVRSKRAKYVPTQFVPKSEWKGFKTIELESLANRLNSIPEKVSKSVNKDDAIKMLKRFAEEGKDVNSEQCLLELLKYGFTKAQCKRYIKDVERQIDDAAKVPAGAVWIDWKVARKEESQRIVEQYRDKDSTAFLMSSGAGMKIWQYLEAATMFPQKTRMKLVVYHPSPSKQREWYQTVLPRIEKTLKLFVKVKVSFIELPTIDHTASLQNPENVV